MSDWPLLDAELAREVSSATARALDEVNGIRGDIGLEPLDALLPAPLDETSDEPLDAHPCPITLSILSGAPDGWTCRWTAGPRWRRRSGGGSRRTSSA